jgi:antitoxin VapB
MEKGRRVRLIRNGRNQAVRIPREYETPGEEAVLRRDGDRLILRARSGVCYVIMRPPCDSERIMQQFSLPEQLTFLLIADESRHITPAMAVDEDAADRAAAARTYRTRYHGAATMPRSSVITRSPVYSSRPPVASR